MNYCLGSPAFRTSTHICYKVGLLPENSFGFHLSGNVVIFPLFLKDNIVIYIRFLVNTFFSLSILGMIAHCFLASRASVKTVSFSFYWSDESFSSCERWVIFSCSFQDFLLVFGLYHFYHLLISLCLTYLESLNYLDV